MSQNNNNSIKNQEKVLLPIKKLRKDVKIPKPSQPGDAGADARIVGFKIISKKKDKKELIEITSKSYTLKPLERIGCQLGFATAIPEGNYFKVVPRSGLALFFQLIILLMQNYVNSYTI